MGLEMKSRIKLARILLLLLIAGPILASDDADKCEPVSVPMCMAQKTAEVNSWMYNQTIFPNLLSHRDQHEAQTALLVFLPLLKIGCSEYLLEFLCSVHVPRCISAKPILPRPSVCKEARKGCKPIMEKFGFLWPEHLNCDRFGTADQSTTHTPVLTTQASTGEQGEAPFLVYSNNDGVRIVTFVPLGTQDLARARKGATGISLDTIAKHVFWVDRRARLIKSTALDKPLISNNITQLKSGARPDDLAVDWINRKIYWTDAGLDTIEVAELDGTSGLVLVNTSLQEPRGIALDPTENGRHIYWTDWGREEAKIGKISMDGDPNTRVVLHNLTGSWPNGITIDFTTRRIFWTDARFKVIESSNLNGSDRRLVIRIPRQHPFSIAVFKDFIYWADWRSRAIFKANKFTGGNKTVIVRELKTLTGLEIFDPLRQPKAQNPCGLYNGGCSHLCLLSSEYGHSCACPTGINLLPNGKTCDTMGKDKCESITSPMCMNEDDEEQATWMYNSTMLPNLLSHKNQNDAAMELHQFFPIVKVKCSEVLQQFLCNLYLPKCSKKVIPPCRSICQKARDGCEPTMMKFGFNWPDNLDCKQFPADDEEELCVGNKKTLSDKKEGLKNATEPNMAQKNYTETVCTIFEYQCITGKCIPTDWRCDGQEDCKDGSDETRCTESVPEKITTLKVIPKPDFSAVVSWFPNRLLNSVPVTSFILNFKEISSASYNQVRLQGHLRSYIVTNLKPRGIYEFSIKASNRIGISPSSDPVLIRMEVGLPGEVLLVGKVVNSSAIHLSWTNPDDLLALGYFVQYKKVTEVEKSSAEESKMITVPLRGNQKEYTITKNIKEMKTYEITVQSFTLQGYGQRMGPIFVTIPVESITPPKFTVKTLNDTLYNSAVFEIPPQENVAAFALRVGKSPSKRLPIIDEKVTLLPASFKGGNVRMEPFMWHFFGLSMRGEDGRWSRERPQWLRGPLNGYTAYSKRPNSVILIWSQIDPKGDGDFYTVSFKGADDIKKSKITVRNNKELGYTRITVGALRSGSSYDFEIKDASADCDDKKTFKTSVKAK